MTNEDITNFIQKQYKHRWLEIWMKILLTDWWKGMETDGYSGTLTSSQRSWVICVKYTLMVFGLLWKLPQVEVLSLLKLKKRHWKQVSRFMKRCWNKNCHMIFLKDIIWWHLKNNFVIFNIWKYIELGNLHQGRLVGWWMLKIQI